MHISRRIRPESALLSAKEIGGGLQILSTLLAQEGSRVDFLVVGTAASTLLKFAEGAADVDFFSPTAGGAERVFALEPEVRENLRYRRQMREAATGVVGRQAQQGSDYLEIAFDRRGASRGRSKLFAQRHAAKYFHPVAFRDKQAPQGLNVFLPTPEALLALRLGDDRAPRERDMVEIMRLARHLGIDTQTYAGFRDQMRDFWTAHRADVPDSNLEVGQKIRKVWEERGEKEAASALQAVVASASQAVKAVKDGFSRHFG